MLSSPTTPHAPRFTSSSTQEPPKIKALIFDVDDCLYPVTNNFTNHRLHEVVIKFMVDELGLPDAESAQELRAPYFKHYHSMYKALSVAASEGALPPLPDGTARSFAGEKLSAYYATHCRFADFIARDDGLLAALTSLKEDAGLRLLICSNGPRAYCLRVLETLGVRRCFADVDM